MIPRVVCRHESGIRRIVGTLDQLGPEVTMAKLPNAITYHDVYFALERKQPTYVLYMETTQPQQEIA